MYFDRFGGLSPHGWPISTIAVALILSLACGRKGDPQPPPSRAPAEPSDLTVLQRGSELVLQMGYPTTTVSGLTLTGLQAVEIWQLVQPAAQLTQLAEPAPMRKSEFGQRAALRLTLEGAELEAATAGDRIFVRLPIAPIAAVAPVADESATEPQEHSFGAKFWAVDGPVSALSSVVSIVTIQPPPIPTSLRVATASEGVSLNWEFEGEGLEGFHLYRRDSHQAHYREPLARLDNKARSYVDRSAAFGNSYIYSVTAVAVTVPLVESRLAGDREVAYRDLFPPPAPQQLVALTGADSVRLLWAASAATDLATYRVERSAEGTTNFQTISPEPLMVSEFIDMDVVSGLTYSYRVKAVDQLGNLSAAGNVVEALIP